MAHPLFQTRFTEYVRRAISRSNEASRVDHPGLQGEIREIAVEELFKPILPPGVEVGTGKIVDSLTVKPLPRAVVGEKG